MQRLRRRDGQHAGAGAEVEHAPRPVRSSAHGRAAAGSRGWCRDGRCRRPAPPRSRWRACSAATRSRSWLPCTTKRPAGTGTRSSRLALTQSLASTVSKTSVSAISFPAAVATSSRSQCLIGRLGKMQRDVPASVRPLEGGDRRVAVEKDLREHIDDALGRGLGADRKAGAMGGRKLHSRVPSVQFLELLFPIFRITCRFRVNLTAGCIP